MTTLKIETPSIQRSKIHLHIGGEARETGSGGIYEHLNPYSQQTQALAPLAGAAEVAEAVHDTCQACGDAGVDGVQFQQPVGPEHLACCIGAVKGRRVVAAQ